MTAYDPPRSREQRKQDVLDRLRRDEDAWVATASPDGVPTLVPLSFLWEDETGTLVMATRRTNPTAVNVTPHGLIRVTVGRTVRAWREENELADRDLMHTSTWLV
ncbi:pyridoxamine 5'-phosphate oxidase family protein [Streptomyces parvus]|uniref:Pyridoxamine 5'-phosphate oxidase family protein n=1 Tax=Streptomyces parvus TaxID=66428 RepID=A0A7K3RTL6_9ACTN|nr:pyridoxamine 5'-phosphate oxidase family protein [Streptomyces parvus]NEC18519.1 hypothetical protein [Streptomyces parvus]